MGGSIRRGLTGSSGESKGGSSKTRERAKAHRPDPSSPHVKAYAQHLRSTHEETLADIGLSGSDLVYSYHYVANAFAVRLTSDQIVGARYYMDGFLQEYGAGALAKGEYRSPRDAMGHGTFCAGVAAGNAGVKVNYATLGSLSGVAPRARIAVYKVIWGGMSSLADVMAAVEDAVKDGVDVLSLAVGGTDDNYFNSIFLLRAVQAGVLVVAPAGNNGPPPTPTYWRTLTNVAPYILTVGASATDREWSATLTLGNGTALFGVTQTGGDGVLTANLPLIDSEEAHAKGAALWEARQCRPGKIDAEKVGGGLVLCYIGITS
ncbi:unnamed protein product [Closterium sp. Naga37s-1]|nr:unnamed protein product [Closterium sp. Naga37s-1]